MRYIILIVFLCSVYLLQGQKLEGEILFKNSYKKVSSDSISINDDSVVYKSKYSNKINTVSKSEIELIKSIDGSYSLEGLGLGVIGAIGYTLLSVPKGESVSDKLLLYSAIGGGIGLIIGKATKKYNTIRFNDNTSFSLLNRVKVMPEANQLNFTLINYNVRF